MKCEDCELLLAQGETSAAAQDHLRECVACRTLAADLSANAPVFEALRSEELPRLAVGIPGQRKLFPWVAAAAVAAAFAIGILLPGPAAPPASLPPVSLPPGPAPHPEPLKIKMLTPDPNVVIYWIVD